MATLSCSPCSGTGTGFGEIMWEARANSIDNLMVLRDPYTTFFAIRKPLLRQICKHVQLLLVEFLFIYLGSRDISDFEHQRN